MNQTKYPVTGTAGGNRVFNYGFDDMGRPKTMTDAGSGAALVSNVTYGISSEVVSIGGSEGGSSWSESRQYNVMGQMTRLTSAVNGSNALDIGYEFPTGNANNGKIAYQQDYVSGERVQYLYDSIQRLQKAETVQAGGTQWGQLFGYDGFSNLVSKTVTKGSAPAMSINVNVKNQVVGSTYDSNGNDVGLSARTYDVLNRMVSSVGAEYEYDHVNKRIYRFTATAEEFYFFGPSAVMGRYTLTVTGAGSSNPSMAFGAKETNHWFGGKLVQKGTYALFATATWTQQDRMGSIGKYYPYGEEKGIVTADDREKFATYTRDATTGLDYADQRWHSAGAGRFLNGDPMDAQSAMNPGTFNQYGYALADPVEYFDPNGLYPTSAQGCLAAMMEITRIGGSSPNVYCGPVMGVPNTNGSSSTCLGNSLIPNPMCGIVVQVPQGQGGGPKPNALAATLVSNFTLQVSVSSGGLTVQCPTVAWQSGIVIQTIDGRLVGGGSTSVLWVR